jgi:CubicO group peptidase (beta-lactamase class C family)
MPAYLLKFSISIIIIFLVGCQPGQKKELSAAHSGSKSPSVPVATGPYIPPVFEQDNRKQQLRSVAPKLKELMVEHANERHLSGLSWGIVVDNELVVADAYGLANREEEIPASTTSAFRIASMTKSFTAMAIIKLRDAGKLSLEDEVTRYLPEADSLRYLTTDAPPIKIKNLLTMTAGFPEDNPWGDRQLEEPEQMLSDLMKAGISFSNVPAYGYEYSNTGFAMLGLLVQRVSGMPYEEYIRKEIFIPLEMNNTRWEIDNVPNEELVIGYRWEDGKYKKEPMLHHGIYGAMGGIITTIEDFSKYVSFHLSAWPPRSNEDNGPVKRSSLREMHTPQFSRLDADATNWNGNPCPQLVGYGYGLRINKDCKGTFQVGHGGALPGFGSNYKFYPELGIGFMAFCNRTYTSPWPWEKILPVIFQDLDLKPRELPVSAVLKERKEQVVNLLQTWDNTLEKDLLAENFYRDRSRDKRIEEAEKMLKRVGDVQEVTALKPENQLRGSFNIRGANGTLHLYFTLTPQPEARVQRLEIAFDPLS